MLKITTFLLVRASFTQWALCIIGEISSSSVSTSKKTMKPNKMVEDLFYVSFSPLRALVQTSSYSTACNTQARLRELGFTIRIFGAPNIHGADWFYHGRRGSILNIYFVHHGVGNGDVLEWQWLQPNRLITVWLLDLVLLSIIWRENSWCKTSFYLHQACI